MEIIKINSYLYKFNHIDNPLTADVFVIISANGRYAFDVGNNDGFVLELNKLNLKGIIISHFHQDHIGNINKVKSDNLYLSEQTYKYVHRGEIVNQRTNLEDGFLEIIPLTSSHSNGSLAVNVNHEYCLVGDAFYSQLKSGGNVYNSQKLKQLIDELTQIDTKYFYSSHQDSPILKEKAIAELKLIYAKRDKNDPFIPAI